MSDYNQLGGHDEVWDTLAAVRSMVAAAQGRACAEDIERVRAYSMLLEDPEVQISLFSFGSALVEWAATNLRITPDQLLDYLAESTLKQMRP